MRMVSAIILAGLVTLQSGLSAAPGMGEAAAREARAGGATYHVRKGDSRIGFTITKWMVFKEEGRFREFDGTIDYDPANPAASRVQITIQARSIDSGIGARDQALKGDDFFDVATYPTLGFVSRRVVARDAQNLQVTGDLTIHGVTRQVTVPVRVLGVSQHSSEGALAGFETTFTIDRTDFGVLGTRWSGGEMVLGHEVTINMLIAASTR